MSSLLYYSANAVTAQHNRDRYSGIERFYDYFKIYGPVVAPVDRTNTITYPLKTTSLFPIPKLRPFTKSYEEICNERARELLVRAEKRDVTLYVFWSGGIDSTCVLVSLLKNATPAQKDRIVVLMTAESIIENPNFYREHIQHRLRRDSSTMFPYLLGGDHIVVNGEHNDQVFGSDMVGTVIMKYGPAVIHQPYDRNLFQRHFNDSVKDEQAALWYVELFERLKESAPVPISTNYEFLWWINFATKWQTVFTRTLSFVSSRNAAKITKEYIEQNYAPFYNTEDFQLWSMLNPDKKIKDTWNTYKWSCKEVIYDFTKDAAYRDTKTKRGSLFFLISQQKAFDLIDDTLKFTDGSEIDAYYEPENDFVV